MGGDTVLVTGGGTGTGRGLAEAFHARGNKVIIAGRRENVLAAAVAENSGMASIRLDVADPANIKSTAARFFETYPDLNVLVNAAGTALCDDAAMNLVMATNVFGPIRLAAASSSLGNSAS